MANETLKDKELLLETYWRRRRYRTIDSVGDVLGRYIAKDIRRSKKSPQIIEAWQMVVPEQMRQFCKVVKIQKGVLTVEVSDSALKFEMTASKKELIASMLECYPKSGIKDVKFV